MAGAVLTIIGMIVMMIPKMAERQKECYNGFAEMIEKRNGDMANENCQNQ
jgi:hypothetical protein